MSNPIFRPRLAIALLTGTALTLAACSGAPPEGGDSAVDLALAEPAIAIDPVAPLCPAPDPALRAALEAQINATREGLGHAPVAFTAGLGEAAQSHACDMAMTGQARVSGSDGSSVVDRVRAVKYTACSSAQLIGRVGDASAQLASWMAHKPDEEILVHKKFDDAGVGVVAANGRLWWSLVLADNCR